MLITVPTGQSLHDVLQHSPSLTPLNSPQSYVKCVVPMRTMDVLPSPCLSSAAPLTSVSAACPNGATQIPPPLRLLTFLLLLQTMCSELLASSHRFAGVHQVLLCLSILPTRLCSWSFHFIPCPARLPPMWGARHRIGLWTNQLVWPPSGLRSCSSQCSGHPQLPKMLRKWGWQEDGSGLLGLVQTDRQLPKMTRGGLALGEPSGFAVLWLYDLSKQMSVGRATYVGKVTYLVLLLFSELCLPQSPKLTLKRHTSWGVCVKLKHNSVHLKTWLTHLDQSLLCAHMYTQVHVQTCWTVTGVLRCLLISPERHPFQQSNGA